MNVENEEKKDRTAGLSTPDSGQTRKGEAGRTGKGFKYAAFIVLIVAALGIGSCRIPCAPSGIYYSTAFECLHENNRGFCIITKERLIYVVNYDEDQDPNSIKILFRGPLALMEDGKYGLKDPSGKVLLTMKSYWWGLKIYADRGDMLYGWRQFGIKPPQ